jgi:iodotyrosine deiodinase
MQNNSKTINGFAFTSYQKTVYGAAEMQQRANDFYTFMDTRRSVRDFTNQPVPKSVIENILLTASSAPSGAHKQPWTFCVVQDPEIKKQIRIAAEKEEYESYTNRMPQTWKDDLLPLQTDWQKPFLETAPYLIIVFKKSYELSPTGEKSNVYYATESCGLACGFLLAAIHNAGLGALTHTPSPMQFLCNILQRPVNEKPFLLIPVGYVADDCVVPDLQRKKLEEVSVWL